MLWTVSKRSGRFDGEKICFGNFTRYPIFFKAVLKGALRSPADPKWLRRGCLRKRSTGKEPCPAAHTCLSRGGADPRPGRCSQELSKEDTKDAVSGVDVGWEILSWVGGPRSIAIFYWRLHLGLSAYMEDSPNQPFPPLCGYFQRQQHKHPALTPHWKWDCRKNVPLTLEGRQSPSLGCTKYKQLN